MKDYPEKINLEDIWIHFENFPMAHLSTIEKDQPRVRLMSLIAFEKHLWLSSKTAWDKVSQIRVNNKVEFTIAPTTDNGIGSIRVTVIARIVIDPITREKLAAAIPWFKQYWRGADDPNFTLIKMEPSRILYDNPYDGKKYTVRIP
jgi:general stress protein 26